MRARKADEVLDAARRVFLEHGFDAASVDQVASAAGVSKATVYSNFHDKEALLAAMIDSMTAEAAAILDRAGAPLDEVEPSSERSGGSSAAPVADRLLRTASALARGVLNPDVIRLRRLAISTAVQFPASAAQYWLRGPAATIAMLERQFAALAARGELDIPDARGSAIQFAYALVGPLQDRTMFEPDYRPTDVELDTHVRFTVDHFLRGMA